MGHGKSHAAYTLRHTLLKHALRLRRLFGCAKIVNILPPATCPCGTQRTVRWPTYLPIMYPHSESYYPPVAPAIPCVILVCHHFPVLKPNPAPPRTASSRLTSGVQMAAAWGTLLWMRESSDRTALSLTVAGV